LNQTTQQPAGRPVVETPLALFEKPAEVRLRNAGVTAQMPLRLVPEILDPIDVITPLRKLLAVINGVVTEFGNIAPAFATNVQAEPAPTRITPPDPRIKRCGIKMRLAKNTSRLGRGIGRANERIGGRLRQRPRLHTVSVQKHPAH
jgi:hypothetical protein